MPSTFRGALTACVLIGSAAFVASPAQAIGNTSPDCSVTKYSDYQVTEISTVDDPPTDVDVIANCSDAESDPMTITAVELTPFDAARISATISGDGSHLVVTPASTYVGRAQLTATVSDGTATTKATIYIHVVTPTNTIDCGPNLTEGSKTPADTLDLALGCYSTAPSPDDAITYHLDVSPASEAANVSVVTIDPGVNQYTVLRFNDQITAATTTVDLTATDGTGASDAVSFTVGLQRDPICTSADADGLVLMEQRSSSPDTLTQPLFCSDPDSPGTPLTYSTPDFLAPNDGSVNPGTLTIDPATSYATFVPTDASWTGIAFYSVEVTDGNNGYRYLQIEVSRYQQADVAVTVTAPSSVVIGTTYATHLRIQNNGPDTVTGTYVDVALPYGSAHGTLPAGCVTQSPRQFECTWATLASGDDHTVDIPAGATGYSFPGATQIGAQYGSDNLRDLAPENDLTPADVVLLNPTSGSAASDTFHGSTASNTFYAGGGNDNAGGGAGADKLFLGVGNDCGEGDSGADLLHGDAGNDAVYGDAGPCVSDAAPRPSATVLTGNDKLYGDAGNDTLHGGPGIDALFGGTGLDKLFGDDGNDVLRGGAGTDVLAGGNGADLLYGDAGTDRFLGGAGNDVIYAHDGVKGEVIDCGAGRDVVHADKGDKVARNCEKVLHR